MLHLESSHDDRKTANQDLFEAEKELNAAREEQRIEDVDKEIEANEELNNTKVKQLELSLLAEGETREAIDQQLFEKRIALKEQEVELLKSLNRESLETELEIAQLKAELLRKQELEQQKSLQKQTDAVIAMASSIGDVVAKAADTFLSKTFRAWERRCWLAAWLSRFTPPSSASSSLQISCRLM